ncbi:MAG: type II/IV secretion system protein [Spiribacter salinus]|uniref:Type II/IV secretion system protein n=1 Tax=Spiribacter salinus TaxID=1335746 RepID=A0A540VSP0_9GAMM|nr:MAG: type II/IV secretion system protein [Spiribacter salinus]
MATSQGPPIQTQRLGDQLIERGLIDERDLEAALAEQKRSGLALGDALVHTGRMTEHQLNEVLAENFGVPAVDPNAYWVDRDVAHQLPEEAARRFAAVILEEKPDQFLVATADPGDVMALDEISRVLPKPVDFRLAGRQELSDIINLVYGRTDELDSIADEISEEITSGDEIDLGDLTMGAGRASAPAVRLLKTLLEDAIQRGVSDIHIEPDEKLLRIRSRKDGILHERMVRQGNIQNALVSLIKLMAGLNITERRLPQDGRFHTRVKGRSIDIRLSTLPQQHGESVVLRLLDQDSVVSSLAQTGMTPRLLERFRRILSIPNGLILVTGPTGSGKSTTLYGALSELNDSKVKIITVEDPVEYSLERVTQVQVHEQIGLDFARVLRTALRQDPDIVMVGEIRDTETAEIALRASITGHRVLSTLHTNDAVSSVNRLLDMGIEPFMLAAALRGIVAQRLLRRICPQCQYARGPTSDERGWLERQGIHEADATQIHEGKGCSHCEQSGYSGRIGIFEFVDVTAAMSDSLRHGDIGQFSRQVHDSPIFEPMQRTALEAVREGKTTVAEVNRVLGEGDEEPL